MTRSADVVRQWVVLIAVVGFMLVGSYALTALNLTGDTGEISNTDWAGVLITPPDWVFAIWGFIYPGLAAWAVFQALPSQRDNPRFRKAGYWLAANAVINLAWIYVFGQRWFLASELLIIAQLATALGFVYQLEIGRTVVRGWERWLRVPASIYAGWLTLANVLSVTGNLLVAGWDGAPLDPVTWAVIMLIVIAVLVQVVRWLLNDPVYTLPAVWAFLGLALEGNALPIGITAAVLCALTAIAFLYYVWQRRGEPWEAAPARQVRAA